jgi:hypothetical protein
MAQLNFDASQVEPDAGFETIPAGWYNVMVDQSEIKPTKAGDGHYLEVRYNVIDGQYKGRKLFDRFNIRNSNPTAQEIGYKQLSALAHAVGILHVQDSQQLHGIPLKVKVKVRKGDGQYEDSNEITSRKNINEPVETAGAAAGSAATTGFTPPAGAPAGFTPPGAPPAPAAPAAPPVTQPIHDPMAAARADGWMVHPQAAGYHYKGQDVKTDADVAALYPAPPPATPPAGAWAPPADGATQPWAQPGGAPAAPVAPAAPQAPAAPAAVDPAAAAAAAAQGAVPPWAKPPGA